MVTKKETKKASNPYQVLDEIENMIEDQDYTKQQAFVQLHILPNEYDNINYIEFNEMMNAKPRDKRDKDITEIFNL